MYSFGPKKPPYCLPCAVAAAGVRQGAGFKPKADRKEAKSFARRREEFLAQRDQGSTVKAPVTMDDSWLDRLDEPSTRPIPGAIPPNVASA